MSSGNAGGLGLEWVPWIAMGTMIVDPSTLPSGRFDYEHVCRTMERRIHLTPPWRQRLILASWDIKKILP